VRHGDDQWFDVVKWVHFAMLNAEELNVNQKNLEEQMKSDNPEINGCSAPREISASSSD